MMTDLAESRTLIEGRCTPADNLFTRTYRVQIAPRLIVIDDVGLPLEDAVVTEIIFPGEAVETPTGR